MRSTNMFYGYKRLNDQRMYGVARRHNDSLEGVVKVVQSLIEKLIAYVKKMIDSIKEKLGLVEEPKYKKALKKIYGLSVKFWNNLSVNKKVLLEMLTVMKVVSEIKRFDPRLKKGAAS